MSLHDKYQSNGEAAREFEDFVSEVLFWRFRLQIHVYRSGRFQVCFGEDRAGVEVKLDRRWRETGNLFIETEERWNNQVAMRPAGIYGPCWLFAIGDFGKFWFFACSTLKVIEEHCRKAAIETAKGFLLPIDRADKWAICCFDFSRHSSDGSSWFERWRERVKAGDNSPLPHDEAWWDEWQAAIREAPTW